MNRLRHFGLIAFPAAFAILTTAACSDSGTSPGGGGGGTPIDSGSTDTAITPKDTGGGGTDSTVEEDTGSTGDVGSDSSGPPKCATELKSGKLAEFLDPKSAKALIDDSDAPKPTGARHAVQLTGAVVTSLKFRISGTPKAVGDSCLWGIYVADDNATFAPFSGALVTSFGNRAIAGTAAGKFTCERGTDLIPEDAKSGDRITLAGSLRMFGVTASSCGKATPPLPPPSPSATPQIEFLCKWEKTSSGAAILPADVATTEIEGGGAKVKAMRGGIVRVKAVEAASATAPGDTSFGKFTLKGTTLVVNDAQYYFREIAPVVKIGDKFEEISGINELDFCTWTIAPRTICEHKPVPTTDVAKYCK